MCCFSQNRKIVFFVLLCVMMLLFGCMIQARVLDDFVDISDWGIYGEGFDTAQTKVEAVTYEGKNAMKFSFFMPPRDGLRYAGPTIKRRNLIGSSITFSLYGNNCGKLLVIRCLDQSNETFQWKGPVVDWVGWKQVTVNLTESTAWGSWGGNNNGKIDGGLSLYGFHIDYGKGTTDIEDTLYFAELEVDHELPDRVSVTFTDPQYSTTTGLYQAEDPSSDGKTDFVNLGGKTARQTNPALGKYFIYIDLDNNYVASIPENTGLAVEIEYYDNYFSRWGPTLQYNALGNDYKFTPIFEMTKTDQWRVAKFVLTDHDFRNKMAFGTDFRIVGDSRFNTSSYPLAVHKVTVQKVALGTLAGTISSEGSGLSGATVTALNSDYPGMAFQATTDAEGNYSLKLPLGTYMVFVGKDGYDREKRENVVVAGVESLNLSLKAGYSDGVFVHLGRYTDANGLYFGQGESEGNAFLTELQGAGDPKPQEARRTLREASPKNFFVFLNVSDQYIYSQLGPVDLTVTYFDLGTGSWRVDYNSQSNAYKEGPEIKKTDTGQWKTVTIRLPDAFFANRTNNNDIRLNAKWDSGEDDEYFAYAKVKKVPTAQIRGVVKNADPQVLLSDAQITLTSTTYRNVVYTATSNEAGEFILPDVALDEYEVVVIRTGFSTYRGIIQVTEVGTLLEVFLEEGLLGFEADFSSVWGLSSGSNFSFDTQEKVEGEGSLKITGGATEQYKGTVRLPVTDASAYKLEIWIKTQGISTLDGVSVNVLQIAEGDQARGWYGNKAKLISTGGSHHWQRFEVTLLRSQMAQDTVEVRLFIRLDKDITGAAWFDKVILKPELSIKQLAIDASKFSPAQNQNLKFSYAVSSCSLVTLEVYSDDFQQNLFEAVPLLGGATCVWDGKAGGLPVADGIYTYRLTAASAGDTVFAEGQVVVDNTGPGKPQILAPKAEEGEFLAHNQPTVLLEGVVDEQAHLEVFREVEGVVELVGTGRTDPLGRFSIEVELLEADNKLWVVAYDDLNNPSQKSQELLVNYDSERAIGIITVENGELISPADGNGVLDELKISFYLLQAGTVTFTVTDGAGVVWEEKQEVTGALDVVLSWAGVNMDQGLVADGIYYYKVMFDNGLEQKTFVESTLYVDNTPPETPIMLFPKAGGTVTGQPLLSWENVTDAVYYQLYLGTEENLLGQEPIQIVACEYQTKNLENGLWFWQLIAVDQAGNSSESAVGRFIIAGLDQSQFDVINFQVGPNPFTPNNDGRREELVVAYTLRQPGTVRVSIINLAGYSVSELELGQQGAGDHQFSWDGRDRNGSYVATGVYLVRLVATNPTSWGPAVKVQPVFVLR